jgi:hypothetical protein
VKQVIFFCVFDFIIWALHIIHDVDNSGCWSLWIEKKWASY